MTTHYTVRAPYWDYETGRHVLSCTFTNEVAARTFAAKIVEHIKYHVNKNHLFPPQQEENETAEAFELRESQWEREKEQHMKEQSDWFDMGHGYFTGAPVIVRVTEEVLEN